MKRAIVYIDGFNLYYGIRSLNNPILKWLNIEYFAKSFLAPNTCLEQVKYFTAMIKGDLDKMARQKLYLHVLEQQSKRLTIIKGHFLKKGKRCPNCNHYNQTFEEKKTDVNIACEMLTDAYEDHFDVAFLVSGDSDLMPPVGKITAKGKIVIIANPPKRKSNELNQVASNSIHMKKYLLPAEIPTKRGKLTMPETWKHNTVMGGQKSNQ